MAGPTFTGPIVISDTLPAELAAIPSARRYRAYGLLNPETGEHGSLFDVELVEGSETYCLEVARRWRRAHPTTTVYVTPVPD